MAVTFYEGCLKITSYANGTAYAVYNASTGKGLFVQGDDANRFDAEVLNAENPVRAYKDNEWDLLETSAD